VSVWIGSVLVVAVFSRCGEHNHGGDGGPSVPAPSELRIIPNDFSCGATPCLGAALHKALIIDRAVLASEMTVSLAHPLVAGERRVLPDLPTRIAAQKIGVGPGRTQGREPVPVSADARPDTVELREKSSRVFRDDRVGRGRGVRGGRPGERGAVAPAHVPRQHARGAGKAARRVPRILKEQIRINVAVARPPDAGRIPVPLTELQDQFRVCAVPELLNSNLLEFVKPRRRIIQASQDTEGKRQDHLVSFHCGRAIRSFESEVVAAPASQPDARERPLGHDAAARQSRGNRLGQELIAAEDAVAFIGEAVNLPGTRRLKAEQIDEIETALDCRIESVFLVLYALFRYCPSWEL
jgi:hypothetical protein